MQGESDGPPCDLHSSTSDSQHRLLSLAISSGACIDAKRLNTDCRWTDNEVRLLDLSREADQRHLTRDVDLADELGIRYGDSFRKSQGINEEHARTANCTSLLFAEIRRSHGVTMEDVTKARGRREISYDLAMVLLPVAVLFCLAVSEIVRRILRRFASDERMPRVIALLLASVFVTGAGFQLGSLWSFVAESYRVRDAHVSYRAAYVPWVRDRAAVLCVGYVLFWIVAFIRYRFDDESTLSVEHRP